MKPVEHPESVLVCWREAFGWDAVYAGRQRGRTFETRPIIGWALIAKLEPGRKSPALAAHGILSIIGSEFFLAGRERSFLGYARAGTDLRASFGKVARARRKVSRGRAA